MTDRQSKTAFQEDSDGMATPTGKSTSGSGADGDSPTSGDKKQQQQPPPPPPKIREFRRSQSKVFRMDVRHMYMAERMAVVLGLESNQLEEWIMFDAKFPKFDNFFAPNGAKTMLFYYQAKPGISTDTKQLVISDVRDIPLLGLAFVFTRTTQRAITTSNYANEVNFTYMDASDGRLLEALEGYLASIVLPGLANLTDWGGQLSASAPGGSTSGKAKIDEYLNALQRLLESLAGARASMQNQILLSDPPDELAQRVQSPVDLQLAVHSSEALEKLERLLLHWAKEIEQVLNESEQVRRETDDVGPTAELTFWKGRMARFNK